MIVFFCEFWRDNLVLLTTEGFNFMKAIRVEARNIVSQCFDLINTQLHCAHSVSFQLYDVLRFDSVL